MSDELAALEAQVIELTTKLAALERKIEKLEQKQMPEWVRKEAVSESHHYSGL